MNKVLEKRKHVNIISFGCIQDHSTKSQLKKSNQAKQTAKVKMTDPTEEINTLKEYPIP